MCHRETSTWVADTKVSREEGMAVVIALMAMV
jgi:hypothetical protein